MWEILLKYPSVRKEWAYFKLAITELALWQEKSSLNVVSWFPEKQSLEATKSTLTTSNGLKILNERK